MCPKSETRFVKKLPKSATRLGKKSPKWQKFVKVAKITKVAKSPQIMLQGVSRVPDGSRSQTARARTTRGTYAWAPYAFAALGQGPKGPELVKVDNYIFVQCTYIYLKTYVKI